MTVPIGTIIAYGGDLSNGSLVGELGKKGWLICDGTAYSRADYSELADVIGNAFGSPSISQFNVPDLRGRFLRGVDDNKGRDPDAQSRTQSAQGGYTGSKVGTLQMDAMQAHKHDDSGHSHPHPTRQCRSGGGDNPAGCEYTFFENSSSPLENKSYAQLGVPTKVEGNFGEPRYSCETRPQNVNVNWLIKAKNVTP